MAIREKPLIEFFEENTKGRDFVVGDMHGCYSEFLALLRKHSFNTEIDRVFSVGDLVDRGLDSSECLRLVEQPWFHATMGNHEEMLLECHKEEMLHGSVCGHWFSNGGSWWAGVDPSEKGDLAALASILPNIICVGNGENRFFVVHSECQETEENILRGWFDLETSLWSRGLARELYLPNEGEKYPLRIYAGHTPKKVVTYIGNHIIIDTGAGKSGYLTMVEVPKQITQGVEYDKRNTSK